MNFITAPIRCSIMITISLLNLYLYFENINTKISFSFNIQHKVRNHNLIN